MRRIRVFSIIFAVLTAVTVLAATPANFTAAQTSAADHEQHHPGTPVVDAAAFDPCAVGVATPAADMPQAGMMTGMPAMGTGDMAGMMGQFDRMFIDMMIPHHASAVAMAQVALSRAEHPEIRTLAEDIITSQRTEIAQMRSWRDQWYPDAPTMPMMDMDQMMAMMGEMIGEMPGGMMGTPGAMPGPGGMGMMMDMEQEMARLCATTEGFDLTFIEAMIPHHQSAIMMAQVATTRAEHPELQALAHTMIDDQQREFAQMQMWRTAWSGVATPEKATSGHDATTTVASEQMGTEQIAVTLTEFSIDLVSTALYAGRPYTFVVTNDGTVRHEFVIERLGATHEPLVAGDQMAMVEGIAPGESKTLEWTFTDPGSYQLACHEPGHYEAGQVLVIEVAD
jgi:uncharacterized protein (DUF305 family)/uncharacterized cupredoxin-like copper-binding protein